MQRWRTLLTLLLAGILSGCAAPPEGPTLTTPTEVQMVQRLPGSPFPPLPLDPVLRTISWEQCRGISSGFWAPEVWVREHVPREFELVVQDGRARISLFAHFCERLVVGHKIFEDLHIVTTHASSIAKQEWAPEPGVSFLVIDSFSSDPAAAEALTGLGFRTEVASVVPSPPLRAENAGWTIQTAQGLFRVEHDLGTELLEEDSSTGYFWHGSRPFAKFPESVAYRYYLGSGDGTIQFEGETRTSKIVKLPLYELNGNFGLMNRTATADLGEFG